uniref:Candidate secreted effector n=1 Tax=Meloidogyne incognita TaxID=6306 RepID=A0A914MXD4_MELIC
MCNAGSFTLLKSNNSIMPLLKSNSQSKCLISTMCKQITNNNFMVFLCRHI